MKKFFIIVLLMTGTLWSSPQIPFGLGAQISFENSFISSGVSSPSVLPFAVWWTNGLGHVKMGYSRYKMNYEDSLSTTKESVSLILIQLGFEPIPLPGHPFVFGNYVRQESFKTTGDEIRAIWSAGIGAHIPVNPFVTFLVEFEHGWIREFQTNKEENISGTRLQLTAGIMVFFI